MMGPSVSGHLMGFNWHLCSKTDPALTRRKYVIDTGRTSKSFCMLKFCMKGVGLVIKPINDSQLQARLGSGSKRRLANFRSSLKADRDLRNYDSDVDRLFSAYAYNVQEYMETKEYLRTLRSSKDGKLFSQGVKSYNEMFVALSRFGDNNHPSFQWNVNYQSAKRSLIEKFSRLRLSEIVYRDDESMVNVLPKTDTHSGFNYLITGKKEKGENLNNIYRNYSNEERKAKSSGSFNKPILPGCRTQGSGAFNEWGEKTGDCKHKTRVISMVDMYVIFAELKFALPIQNAMASMDMYAGGKDPRRISSIITYMRHKYGHFISLDYSHFDQSISDWLIYDAFDIIRSAFEEVDEELFQIVVNDFIHKNFIHADGVLYSRKGVPSGSMFTQIVDSIVNVLMVTTYLNSFGTSGEMIVMGDDNLLYTRDKVSVDAIASYITKNFGVVVNADKTSSDTASHDPEFLSRVWRYNGQWREPHTVVAKMLYPERYRNYKSGRVRPELVLYAYILTYPLTMGKLMDISKYLSDFPYLRRDYVFDIVDSRYLPGGLAYIRDYTRTKDVN